MTKATYHTSNSATCVALDGSICRQPVAKDGRGLLCDKHMARLRLGEEITISKQAGSAAEAILEELTEEVRGNAKPLEENSGGDSDSEAVLKPKDVSINLVSIAVISALGTAYAALILYFQAPQFDLPFGMTLSGFNSTAAALQNLPHVLTVVLLAIVLLVATSIGVACTLGLLILVFALAGRVISPLLKITSDLWGWLPIGGFVKRLLIHLRRDASKPVLAEQVWADLVSRLKRIFNWLERARKRTREGVKFASGFPYQVIYLGKGSQGRVIFSRLAVVVLVLALGIPLAIWNADDRERQIHRAVAKDSKCAKYGLAPDCPDIEPHKVLDWFDKRAAKAQEQSDPIALPYDEGLLRVANVWAEKRVPIYLAQLSLLMRENFRPRVAVGTFVYSSRDAAPTASHILAQSGTIGKSSFRTEELVHIGDFGDWVYVAKVADPNKRLLIRRSAIMEFSMDSSIGVLNTDLEEEVASPKTDLSSKALIAVLQQQNSALRVQVDDLQTHLKHTNVHAFDKLSVAINRRNRNITFKPTFHNITLGNGITEAGWPDLGALVSHGVASRVPSVFDDLVRRHGNTIVAQCLRNGTTLAPIPFAENHARWPDSGEPESYRKALKHLKNFLQDHEAGKTSRLVFLRGGASFTGSSIANLQLSEKRAKWVKSRLLTDLFKDSAANAADLAAQASAERHLHFVAFGIGERMSAGAASSRVVEIVVCELKMPAAQSTPEKEKIAQN